MLAKVTLPRERFTIFIPVLGRGLRSPYIQPFTALGDSSNSFAARSMATGASGCRDRMNAGRDIIAANVPRNAEIMQYLCANKFPRFGQLVEISAFMLSPMDYKKEIGRRIRLSRDERGWTLEDLARETEDVLSLKRINAYENGDRMPGPAEIACLGKALGKRSAYLMALDDTQIPISSVEEKLVKNWRTMPERERMEYFRRIEALAMTYRDPVQDQVVERHLPNVKNVPPTRKVRK